jgi:DNA helicase-2/ATP-dependent DNA helicase PcrA
MLDCYERFMYGKRHQFAPKDYQDALTYGRQALAQFFDEYSRTWSADADYKTEYRIDNIHVAGVPVKGFIDRVDKLGDMITVSDYKSGKLESSIAQKAAAPSEKYPEGGTYWRQIVFYDLMLEADPRYRRHFDVGIIQGLEPNKDGKFIRREINVSADDRDFLRNLITDTYAKIQAMEFSRGCGECAWCRMHGIAPPLPDGAENGGEKGGGKGDD